MSTKEITSPAPDAISSLLPDRTTLLAFIAFIVVSGGASVAIRFTYAEMPPFWSGSARFICGALFFWIAAFIRKVPLPRGRALVGAILFGVFSMGLSFTFIYWGLVKTPASLYQTIVALVPLLTLFFAFFHGLEPFRGRGLVGALLTVVGIVIAVGGASSDELSILHILAINVLTCKQKMTLRIFIQPADIAGYFGELDANRPRRKHSHYTQKRSTKLRIILLCHKES